MRKAIALTLALAVSGCAAHQAAAPLVTVPTPPPSSDWSVVCALPKGAFVLVALGGNEVRQGSILGVTDTTLTIRDAYGAVAIPRVQIALIANRVQRGTTRAPRYVEVPIVTAVLGGLAAFVVGAIEKHGTLKRAGWSSLVLGLTIGLVTSPLNYPRPTFVDRVVYVRPGY